MGVSLGELAAAYERAGSTEERIWKLLAYVGRYGHQPVNVARQLTVRDLHRLAGKVAEIVEQENAAGKGPHNGD
jgi:hypothetical protein